MAEMQRLVDKFPDGYEGFEDSIQPELVHPELVKQSIVDIISVGYEENPIKAIEDNNLPQLMKQLVT